MYVPYMKMSGCLVPLYQCVTNCRISRSQAIWDGYFTSSCSFSLKFTNYVLKLLRSLLLITGSVLKWRYRRQIKLIWYKKCINVSSVSTSPCSKWHLGNDVIRYVTRIGSFSLESVLTCVKCYILYMFVPLKSGNV